MMRLFVSGNLNDRCKSAKRSASEAKRRRQEEELDDDAKHQIFGRPMARLVNGYDRLIGKLLDC